MVLILRLARTLFNVLLLSTCIVIGLTIWLQQRDRTSHLALIPKALRATGISYQKEEFWGFGPGAHESGALIYSLPAATARAINERGLSFFAALGAQWPDWRPTPIPGVSNSPTTDYLERYAGEIMIAPVVATTIDDAVLHSGSYYAFTAGGGGLIVVNPAKSEAYYLFSG